MQKSIKHKALLYIRVSTDEQAKHGYSIDMQQDQCRQFAQRNNLQIDKIFIDDGYTAKNMRRPQLKSMIEHIAINYKSISSIIVWRLDRLCRNTDDYYASFKPIFASRGIELLSATENNDMDNPYGRYMRNIQINNAELESNLTSIRTIANLREKAKQGSFPGARVPIGYKRIGKERNKKIVPDPETISFVKYVFELYTSGLFSYASLARKMRADGYTPRGKSVTKKMIENILVTYLIFYTGKFKFGGVVYDGKHEPIINKETYLSVLKIRNQHSSPKTQTHSFLYRGLIKCAKTEKLLTAETHKGAHKSGNYVYYRCPKNCDQCNDCKCFLKEEVIDNAVKEALDLISLTPENYDNLKENFRIMLDYQKTFDGEKKAEIERSINRLKTRINNLYDDKLDGLISAEMYMKKREEFEYKLDEKLLEYSAINKTNVELIRNLEELSEPLKNLSTYYFQRTDFEKRYLLKLLCPNLFYDGSKVVISIKSAFIALFNFAIFKNGAPDGIRTHAYRNHNPRS